MSQLPWLLEVSGRWIEVSDADLHAGVADAAKDLDKPALLVSEAVNLLLTQGRLKRNPKAGA